MSTYLVLRSPMLARLASRPSSVRVVQPRNVLGAGRLSGVRRATMAPMSGVARALSPWSAPQSAATSSVARPAEMGRLARHVSGRLYSTAAQPVRRPTLGPDAGDPTTVTNPAYTRSGQLLRVSVTETAAAKLKEIAASDTRPDLVLRIHVESGGCHGFQYVFQLQDGAKVTDKDSVFTRDGARVIIDHRSLRILRDATIDYTTELIGSQFKATSPHTSSSCGCGSSFSLDSDE